MAKKLPLIHPHAAGIDIGAEEIYVSVPEKDVRSFQTFTTSLLEACRYLQENEIETVAMEATGIYWIPLYNILDKAGFDLCLVNGAHIKNVPGRKSDVKDCQWIQELHSFGLLSSSFIPEDFIRKLRSYMRLREKYIASSASYIQRMQKALDLMNIKLHNVISQIQGASGMRIIKAILNGERDPKTLTELCENQILNHKRERVEQSLHGEYQPEHLFALKQALECWEFYQTKIHQCDQEIERLLLQMTEDLPAPEKLNKPKAIRHHKPQIADLHLMLMKLTTGKDPTLIPGLTDLTLMQLIAETGLDMSKWPTSKHFVSWVGLAPLKDKSGKGYRKKRRPKTKAGQIFRLSAQALGKSKYPALAGFYKRIRARSGSKVAMVATARKIAILYYHVLKHGAEYVEEGIEKYHNQYRQRQEKYLHKLAGELGLKVSSS